MTTAPNFRAVRNQIGRGQLLRLRKVSVDAIDCRVSIARQKVARHEPEGMLEPIFSFSKAIDALGHILAAQVRVVAVNALTFDDGVRIVLFDLQKNLDHINWYVGEPIGSGEFGA